MVVGHEGVELQGVELKAGVVDVLNILHGVFVHGQQGGGLEDGKQESIAVSWKHSFYLFVLDSPRLILQHVLFIRRNTSTLVYITNPGKWEKSDV